MHRQAVGRHGSVAPLRIADSVRDQRIERVEALAAPNELLEVTVAETAVSGTPLVAGKLALNVCVVWL